MSPMKDDTVTTRTTPTRRSMMRTVAWATPATVVATAAPAFAVSACPPVTEHKNSAIAWTSSQIDFSSDNGDPEFHTVQYVFTNNGPDALPTGTTILITLDCIVLSGERADFTIADTSKATASVSQKKSHDDDTDTDRTLATVTAHPTEEIPVGQSFYVSVLGTYGALANGDLPDSVDATPEDTKGCGPTDYALTISGQSDGTSWTTIG